LAVSRLRLAPALLVLACGPRVDPDAQQSAGRIARAVEQLRNAPNAGKPVALAALGKLSCTGSDVCETRDACAKAYTEHVDALSLTAAAKLKLESDGAEAARLLGAAEQKLGQAALLVSLCTEREAALRRRYKL
jgi:hypothetical protein